MSPELRKELCSSTLSGDGDGLTTKVKVGIFIAIFLVVILTVVCCLYKLQRGKDDNRNDTDGDNHQLS